MNKIMKHKIAYFKLLLTSKQSIIVIFISKNKTKKAIEDS